MTAAFVVTAGPSISARRITALVPHARIVAPIAFGDAFGYGLDAGDTLLVLDGLFAQAPSVRHRELLGLLDDGVRVAGASSMGALRAAELAPYGMAGYGRIYQSYLDGTLEADDEVAMVHGAPEDGWPVFVDALVNMRATLARAESLNVLSSGQHLAILAAARARCFTARGWPEVLDAAGCAEHSLDLARELRRLRVDVKRADAELALTRLAAESGGAGTPGTGVQVRDRPRPGENMFSSRWRARQQPPRPIGGPPGALGQPIGPGPSPVPVTAAVRDLDVFTLLRLCASDSWFMRAALEQIAAWHADLACDPRPGESVLDRAHRACSALGESLADSRPGPSGAPRALELTALAHLDARGVCGTDGPDDRVMRYWCTRAETDGLDAPARAALLASRAHLQTPAEPALAHPMSCMLADPRLGDWQRWAEAATAAAAAATAARPDLDLRRPQPNMVAELFARRWGVFAPPELARRGFVSLSEFNASVGPFVVAGAQGQLPTLTVGRLGART